jgi:hypothetical protein
MRGEFSCRSPVIGFGDRRRFGRTSPVSLCVAVKMNGDEFKDKRSRSAPHTPDTRRDVDPWDLAEVSGSETG